jgi:phosphatidylglycerophosphate synthase
MNGTFPPVATPLTRRPTAGRPPPVLHGLLAQFGLLVGVNLGLLLGLIAVLSRLADGGLGVGPALGIGLYVIVNALLFRGLVLSYPHGSLGLCNVVTHIRATLTASLASVVPAATVLATDQALAWSVAGIAVAALVCDGIDGWAARRSRLVSAFGARFDMEVDSVLALVLALIVLRLGKVGDWVILLGVMHYLFVAAMWVFPRIARPTPPRMSGKVICVLQIAALIALMTPVVTPPLAPIMAGAVLLLVAWSFAVDLRWLWQTRTL